jgi:hypothetical protein
MKLSITKIMILVLGLLAFMAGINMLDLLFDSNSVVHNSNGLQAFWDNNPWAFPTALVSFFAFVGYVQYKYYKKGYKII